MKELRRLGTQEQVVAVVGPSPSGEAAALRPISASLRVPVMAIAASNAIITPPDEARYMFKEFPASLDPLRAPLTYAQEQGWRRVAILSSNNGYGQELANALPSMIGEFGLELVGAEVFPPDATDMTPQPSVLAGRRRASRSWGSKVLVSDQIPADDPQGAVLSEFVAAWQGEYGSTPSQYAAGGWDSILLTIEALRGADPALSDVQVIRDALRDGLERTNAVLRLGRVRPPTQSRRRRRPAGYTTSSRVSRNGPTSSPGRCRAASSRWWPSAGR